MNTQSVTKMSKQPGKMILKNQISCLLFFLTPFFNPVWAGEVTTGKIIIDGVSYGDANSRTIRGSGKQATEIRKVGEFRYLNVNAAVEVHYRPSQIASIAVTGDDNLLQLVQLRNKADTLIIDVKNGYNSQQPLVVDVKSPALEGAVINGSGDAFFYDLDEREFSLELNGSSNLLAQGKAKQLSIMVNGSGDVNAKSLESERVGAAVRGSGDISLLANQSLKATISGSGDIYYRGSPADIEKAISGSGELVHEVSK
jgi:Putative auto-transporter adhesin, head GIN domain